MPHPDRRCLASNFVRPFFFLVLLRLRAYVRKVASFPLPYFVFLFFAQKEVQWFLGETWALAERAIVLLYDNPMSLLCLLGF